MTRLDSGVGWSSFRPIRLSFLFLRSRRAATSLQSPFDIYFMRNIVRLPRRGPTINRYPLAFSAPLTFSSNLIGFGIRNSFPTKRFVS